MNFFGHAVAASWRRSTPEFTLGAMLPDFASMLGSRVLEVGHAEVAEGVSWHHRTDAVFHRLSAFRQWSSMLTRRLADRGASRGSSLAAGHVGVELLLDGVLVDREPELRELYLGALDAVDEVAAHIRWRDDAPQVALLARQLSARGLPIGYRDPAIVAERVIRVLVTRPRLAMPPAQAAMLEDELDQLRPTIAAGAGDLCAELERELG